MLVEAYSKKVHFFKKVIESSNYLRSELGIDYKDTRDPSEISWLDISKYFLACAKIEEDDHVGLTALLQKSDLDFLRSNNISIQRVTVDNIADNNISILSEIYQEPDKSTDDEGVYRIGPFVGDSTDFDEERSSIELALKVLELCSPGYYRLVSEMVDTIYVCGPLEGGFMRSATTVKSFGCLVNTALTKKNVVQYIEDLVHESSHLLLYLEQINDPIVLNNKDQRYPAPFRDDLRPLEGIYHAMFVLGQVYVCFVDIYISNTDLIDRALLLKHMGSVWRRFKESADIVEENGDLTEAGQVIFKYIRRLAFVANGKYVNTPLKSA